MKPELRVALLGTKFIGRAHSNAFSRVNQFFDPKLKPVMAVVCGRDAINIGGIDAQGLERIIQFMWRTLRRWQNRRRQKTPEREKYSPRLHTRSVVTFGMREQGGRRRHSAAD